MTSSDMKADDKKVAILLQRDQTIAEVCTCMYVILVDAQIHVHVHMNVYVREM